MAFTLLISMLALALPSKAQSTSVGGDGWDDFANNLATDLAPIFTLFGEQVTKQFMSECISHLDYAIFAIAPIGIITALVSAIRVCGSSSLRAFVGRAQEGTAVAESELCSSTSHDVGEVYTNGGIARVFGQPRLLEVVYVPRGLQQRGGGKLGKNRDRVFTFEELYCLQGDLPEWSLTRGLPEASPRKPPQQTLRRTSLQAMLGRVPRFSQQAPRKSSQQSGARHTFIRYTRRLTFPFLSKHQHPPRQLSQQSSHAPQQSPTQSPEQALRQPPTQQLQNSLEELSEHPPNLSLNVGIKRRPSYVSWSVAAIGVSLQLGLLVFAAVVTYSLRWPKDGKVVETYACPLLAAGTLFLTIGTFLCALLVGQTTHEYFFEKTPIKTPPSIFYWLQPGNQRLGDQVFGAFSYTDCETPIFEYVRSLKAPPKDSPELVLVTVFVTAAGFVMQFVGLRGVHSSIAVAQLGLSALMTFLRSVLHTSRIDPRDNLLEKLKSSVHGHELDWLAIRMVNDFLKKQSCTFIESRHIPDAVRPINCWGFRRLCPKNGYSIRFSPDQNKRSPTGCSGPTSELLAVRAQLALISSGNGQVPVSRYLEEEKVAVRLQARSLCSAFQRALDRFAALVADGVVTLKPGLGHKLFKHVRWSFAEYANPGNGYPSTANLASDIGECGHLSFEVDGINWRMMNPEVLEAILGLWVWSYTDTDANCSGPASGPDTSTDGGQLQQMVIVTSEKGILTQIPAWGPSAPGPAKQSLELLRKSFPYALAKPINSIGKPIPETRSTNLADASDLHHGYLEQPMYQYNSQLPPQLPSSPSRAVIFGWHAIPSPTEASQVYVEPSGPNSLLSLCAREIYGSFMADLMETVEHAGSVVIKRTRRPGLPEQFSLDNPLVTELIGSFEVANLGTTEAALKCVLPSVTPRLESASVATVRIASHLAEELERQDKWHEAEKMLRWAWNIVTTKEAYMWGSGESSIERRVEKLAHERLLVRLCEHYRSALSAQTGLAKKPSIYMNEGIDWIGVSLNSIDDSAERQIFAWQTCKRYSAVLETFQQHARQEQQGHSPLPSLAHSLAGVQQLTGRERMVLLATLSKHKLNPLDGAWLQDRHGFLEQAILHDWPEVVMALLQASPAEDIDGPDDHKGRWLELAVKSGAHRTVTALLLAGASWAYHDSDGLKPIHQAAQKEDEAVTLALLEFVARNDPDKAQRTAISMAAEKGDEKVASLLLRGRPFQYNTNGIAKSAESGLDAKDLKHLSALHYAATGKHGSMVAILLKASSITPGCHLRQAVKRGIISLAEFILQSNPGLDINAKGKRYENTALMIAAETGSVDMLKLLLSRDPDVNLENRGHWSAVFFAVQRGDLEITKLLLDRGADLRASKSVIRRRRTDLHVVRPYDGVTPYALCLAAIEGNTDMVRLLIERGARLDVDEAMVFSRSEEITKLLLDSGAKVYATGSGGKAALHYAAWYADRGLCKLLIDRGASIYARDNGNRTPLDMLRNESSLLKQPGGLAKVQELSDLLMQWRCEYMAAHTPENPTIDAPGSFSPSRQQGGQNGSASPTNSGTRDISNGAENDTEHQAAVTATVTASPRTVGSRSYDHELPQYADVYSSSESLGG